MTITGVNLALAAGIVAAIGEISRFNSPQKLVSYFGLIGSRKNSAKRSGREPLRLRRGAAATATKSRT